MITIYICIISCSKTRAGLSVVAVERSVHAALRIRHQVLRAGKMTSKPCKTIASNADVEKIDEHIWLWFEELGVVEELPSSYALAATLAAICADMFLIFVKGG